MKALCHQHNHQRDGATRAAAHELDVCCEMTFRVAPRSQSLARSSYRVVLGLLTVMEAQRRSKQTVDLQLRYLLSRSLRYTEAVSCFLAGRRKQVSLLLRGVSAGRAKPQLSRFHGGRDIQWIPMRP